VCLFSTLAVPILFAAQNGKNHQPTFTAFDPPGSAATFPKSNNPAGAITGLYDDASGVSHGFLRAPDGTITTFDVPGSTYPSPQASTPQGGSRDTTKTRRALISRLRAPLRERTGWVASIRRARAGRALLFIHFSRFIYWPEPSSFERLPHSLNAPSRGLRFVPRLSMLNLKNVAKEVY
jgi:hypothetical protein